MRLNGAIQRTEENEQNIVSAYLDLKKIYKEGKTTVLAQKSQCFHQSASINKKQRTKRNGNKGEPNYFRRKDKTKMTNKY